jgi:hypothetical protein
MKRPWLIPATAVLIAVLIRPAPAGENTNFILLPKLPNGVGDADKIPLVKLEDVPLWHAIRNLARQAGINYIIDPELLRRDGDFRAPIVVNGRWEDITAKEVLDQVLKRYNLFLIENPETSIARVSRVRPTNSYPAGQLRPASTNEIVPLIVMEQVPLDAALMNLIRQMRMKVVVDPAVMKGSSRTGPPPLVSIRWENVTLWQATRAVVNNYDLVIITNRVDQSLWIQSKDKPVPETLPLPEK